MQEILSKAAIGSRIRSLRVQNGFSQEVTAKFLGMSRGNYSQIELGNQFPTYEILYKLSLFYGVLYDWILHGHAVANTEIPAIDLPRPDLGSVHNLIRIVKNSDYYNYLSRRNDRTFIDTLDSINIPGDQEMSYINGIYRAFEISDFGMEGIVQKEDVITARNIMNTSEIVFNDVYVIVTHEEILVRRLVSYFADTNVLVCKSDNSNYPLSVVKVDEVAELWHMWEIFSTKISGLVEEMEQRVRRFEETIAVLRKNMEIIQREQRESEKKADDQSD